MPEVHPTAGAPVIEPICPNCREPLRENLRRRQLTHAEDTTTEAICQITFCGARGWTLHVSTIGVGAMGRPGLAAARAAMMAETVAEPDDTDTIEDRFQLRCRDLIGTIRTLGFDPGVWVRMINTPGAVGASKKLLADHHGLAVTPWPLRRGQRELTMEHEVAQPSWNAIFTDEDRAECARRLVAAGPPDR